MGTVYWQFSVVHNDAESATSDNGNGSGPVNRTCRRSNPLISYHFTVDNHSRDTATLYHHRDFVVQLVALLLRSIFSPHVYSAWGNGKLTPDPPSPGSPFIVLDRKMSRWRRPRKIQRIGVAAKPSRLSRHFLSKYRR
jgi:hypothetical protein